MGETQVWQSTSGATASMVVSVSGLSRPILWNDEDRNLEEMQPRASNKPPTNGDTRSTLIEHFDGTRWSIVPSPNGDQPINWLTSVSYSSFSL